MVVVVVVAAMVAVLGCQNPVLYYGCCIGGKSLKYTFNLYLSVHMVESGEC